MSVTFSGALRRSPWTWPSLLLKMALTPGALQVGVRLVMTFWGMLSQLLWFGAGEHAEALAEQKSLGFTACCFVPCHSKWNGARQRAFL